jgi:hypothetical protein
LPATPCPTLSLVLVGIGWRAVGGEKGKETPVFYLGQPIRPRGTMLFFFFQLIYSIQIQL